MAAFHQSQEFFIKASLDPEFSCLSFPEGFSRAKKNSAGIFPELTGLKILNVQVVHFDRSLTIALELGYELLFKMHGNRSNVLLMHEGKCLNLFKNNLKKDRQVTTGSLSRDLLLEKERFLELKGDPKAFWPVLGKSFDVFFDESHYREKPLETQWKIFNDLLRELQNPTYHICEHQGLPEFRLLPCPQKILFKSSDPVKAINKFYTLFTKEYYLNREKKALLQPLENGLKKIKNYIQKTEKKLAQLKSAIRYDQLADIIMANLHQFKPGVEKLTLDNFYSNGTIEVHLKPRQAPQNLAGQYYRKAKNQKIEIETLTSNIERSKERAEVTRDLIEEIEKAETVKMLRALRQKSSGVKPENDLKALPYHEVAFMGFMILIGKSAAKNDVLTFKVASKEDLWLHVKDASGSHVIVRQRPGQNFPQPVIEKGRRTSRLLFKAQRGKRMPRELHSKKICSETQGCPAWPSRVGAGKGSIGETTILIEANPNHSENKVLFGFQPVHRQYLCELYLRYLL